MSNEQRIRAVALMARDPDAGTRDVYEFGIYTGTSVVKLQDLFRRAKVKPHHVWAFDAFEGLPSDPSVWLPAEARRYTGVGKFSAVRRLQLTSVAAAVEYVENRAAGAPGHLPTTFIPGYFRSVLTDELAQQYEMRPASYIDVDVDLCGSTLDCLRWMARCQLLAAGTLIGYDDWGATKEYEAGESRAHQILLGEGAFSASLVGKYGKQPHIKALFRVEEGRSQV